MLNTVKNVMHRFDGAGDLAKDLVHRLDGAGDLAKSVGATSADLAKTVGVASVALAKKVGVKRGLAGFAILGAAAIGGILLARYLKSRREMKESIAASEAAAAVESSLPARDRRIPRKNNHAHQ
ncbi:MAG TPA: hypothetical protein VIU61_15570 [Kofleriaceae bacterium]